MPPLVKASAYKHGEDPGTDDGRLDLIFKYFLENEYPIFILSTALHKIIGKSLPQKETRHLEELMAVSGLVDATDKYNYFQFKLTTEGRFKLEEYGSYSNWMNFRRDQSAKQIEKTQLAETKMWYDAENAKTTFDNFPVTEKRAFWSLGLSAAALAISIIALFIKGCGQ